MDQPKYLNEYINQMLFDMGQIGPQHLQSIRIGLLALYRRIKHIEIYADLNESIIEVAIRFKWWSVFTQKRKFLFKLNRMLTDALPKMPKISNMYGNQPVLDQKEYDVRIGILKGDDKVEWLKNGKEENRSKRESNRDTSEVKK